MHITFTISKVLRNFSSPEEEKFKFVKSNKLNEKKISVPLRHEYFCLLPTKKTQKETTKLMNTNRNEIQFAKYVIIHRLIRCLPNIMFKKCL